MTAVLNSMIGFSFKLFINPFYSYCTTHLSMMYIVSELLSSPIFDLYVRRTSQRGAAACVAFSETPSFIKCADFATSFTSTVETSHNVLTYDFFLTLYKFIFLS